MPGLRIHITGSAAADCDADLLARAHGFVRELTTQLINSGGGLVLGAGAEPVGDAGLPCTFDWTALEVLAESPDPAPAWPPLRAQRFVTIASQRGLEKVPEQRATIWEACRSRSDFQLVVAPPGWRMAGIIRERQVQHGDILLGTRRRGRGRASCRALPRRGQARDPHLDRARRLQPGRQRRQPRPTRADPQHANEVLRPTHWGRQ